MENQPIAQLEDAADQGKTWRGVRWWICGFLFFATVLSYVDRGVIGMLKSDLQRDLGWTETNYGDVVAIFSFAYAIGYVLDGRLIDLIGVRIGLGLCVGVWSLAAMGHGLVRSLLGFKVARLSLGLAEGGNFPGAMKTVAEWFPKKERSLATGLFNAGSNLGAILTPVIVTWITLRLSWPWCFLVTGTAGLLWLALWLIFYRSPDKHRRCGPAELDHIRSDAADGPGRIAWLSLLKYRITWAFVIGQALSAPIFWFYLYWLPDFLGKKFHLDKSHQQMPLIVVYLMADVGSVSAGWISSSMIKRGTSINVARKATLLGTALFALPVFAAPTLGMWGATLVVGMAAFAHQGFVANLFPLVSDIMPRREVSSVMGIGGMAAGFVAMGYQKFSGRLLDTHPATAYSILFGIASSAYLVNWVCIQLLIPRLEPIVLTGKNTKELTPLA